MGVAVDETHHRCHGPIDNADGRRIETSGVEFVVSPSKVRVPAVRIDLTVANKYQSGRIRLHPGSIAHGLENTMIGFRVLFDDTNGLFSIMTRCTWAE